MDLYLDTETFNGYDDLKTSGTYRYAETAEIMLLTYAWDGQEVRCIDFTDPDTDWSEWDALRRRLESRRCTVIAHNAMFDRNVLRLGNLRYNIPINWWECTMVQAMCHALPAGLGQLGKVLGLPYDQQKLADGRKLINRFCKLAPANHKADRYDRYTHPEEWERFKEYAIQDVAAMRECRKRMPDVNWKEDTIREWHLDQHQNDRGFLVDCELVRAGAKASQREKEQLTRRFAEISGGLAPTQREKCRQYLNSTYGLKLSGTARHFVEPLLGDARVHPDAQEMIRIMLMANKNSTAKYAALNAAVSSDGRFRGGIQFAGAARTRRAAGRVFQPQNLPSRGLPPEESINRYIEALKLGGHDLIFDDLMRYGSAALRGVVVAPKGEKLAVSDLSNIEGRGLSWCAGEEWKLQAFRDYDSGDGPDPYNITATSIIGGDPWGVDGRDRNVFGKVPDLALGYGGGVKALQTFAKAYGVSMADYWDTIKGSIDRKFVDRAIKNYNDWGESNTDLPAREWCASEAVKLAWRARHPKTVKFWRALEGAAKDAINNEGQTFKAGKHISMGVRTVAGHRYLFTKLPSGKYLCYFHPHFTSDGSLAYWGMGDDEGKKIWRRQFTYGGKLAENVVQAIARDVLYHNQPVAERAGFKIVVHIHDENVTETERSKSVDELSAIMATPPPWAADLPLAAAGFETDRYRKD